MTSKLKALLTLVGSYTLVATVIAKSVVAAVISVGVFFILIGGTIMWYEYLLKFYGDNDGSIKQNRTV